MGRKGAKLTAESARLCEQIASRLASLGDVSSRKMFGGFGLFCDGRMFALITSEAELHLKADDENSPGFEEAGWPRYGRMPYYRVPAPVLGNDASLLEHAASAVAAARRAKP